VLSSMGMIGQVVKWQPGLGIRPSRSVPARPRSLSALPPTFSTGRR